MSERKIALLTMLIVFIILIVFTAIFARFALDIDFSKSDKEDSEQTEDLEEEDVLPDEIEPSETENENSDNKEEDKDKTDKDKEEQDEKDKEKEEDKLFQTESIIKSAKINVKGKINTEFAVEEEEKCKLLLEKINALKLTEIHQSVALQNTNWEAQIKLTMADGKSYQLNLNDSTISGSKTTLLDTDKTYESTASLKEMQELITSWQKDAKVKNDAKIGEQYFAQASRVILVDPSKLESYDVAASKSTLQTALSELNILETHTGRVNPGTEKQGINFISLADKRSSIFTLEFYETGILAYRDFNNQTFYVCEAESLNHFYNTVAQMSASYAVVPAHLALMDYSALSGMEVKDTTRKPVKNVGLIRDHAEQLFSMLQKLQVSANNVRNESQMLSNPEYHILIEFGNDMSYEIDIKKGTLLLKDVDGNIYHYVLVGDDNLANIRSEIARLTAE